jgi:murein DD-endopeptidase MepM/ murein hydrolase activator NlpD
LYAFHVEVVPDNVIPGDVFLLKLRSNNPSSAEAVFRDNRVNFYPLDKNYLIALVPVDVNTPPKKYKVTIKHGEEKQIVIVTVRSHRFKTIKLTLPEEKVTLSPENQKRVAQETELLKSIWLQSNEKLWDGDFSPPIDTEISEVFGIRRIMNEKRTSVHRGMDFRGETGTPVKAINSGTVVLADELFFGGNTLIVDHGMGLYSVYMHLSKFNISEGERVSKGQIIGFVGSSGRATGPHLHLSVKLYGISINPESLFKLKL